uniref:NADP-dependent oxidoreductase domain-containing protein n=1 Tax=Moniliophthora roreri TaxID=221103 RepID=A0A0W0FC17_MONRR
MFGLRHLNSSFNFRSVLGPFRCHHGAATATAGGLPAHYTLNNGAKIPSVALGVWQAGKGEVGPAVKTALNAGYRHIDGAWIYRNEKEVGAALRESGVPRDQVWLTSKLWNSFHAPEDVEPALDESLAKLGTDYLDLYIIHWPLALKKDGTPYDKDLTENPYPTWQALERLVEKGKVKNIGVSNSKRVSDSLNVPVVKEIAAELGITPAQVIISWHVQRGTVVLPKSVTPCRVEENIHITKLPDELFEKLEKAATSHKPERGSNPSKSWGLDFDIFD